VVNEAVADSGGVLRSSFWLNTLGESYIADAFRFARAADANADLCINDYSIEGMNAKSNRLFTLVQSLLQQNVPITCVGFQSHLVINQIPSDFQANMQRFANLGLKVRITELDIRIPLPADAQELQIQANNYTTVVNACKAVSSCVGITTWGIDDGSSWLPNSCCGGGNEAAALLWNASFQQKPAYAAVNTALGGGGQQVPGTPGTPAASNVTASSLSLSWAASSGTVTNYQIERATGATSTAFTQVGTSTTTSFNDSGLAANTTYRYRVRATNSAGNSPYSAITNVTTLTGGGTSSCTYRIDQWDVGYVAYVTVNGPTSGWSINVTLGTNNTITNSWNVTLTGTGTTRTATNVSYNGNLAAGQSTQWGFQASRPAGGPLPTFAGCTLTP
jgi:endo-1,4-beta-xylanase